MQRNDIRPARLFCDNQIGSALIRQRVRRMGWGTGKPAMRRLRRVDHGRGQPDPHPPAPPRLASRPAARALPE